MKVPGFISQSLRAHGGADKSNGWRFYLVLRHLRAGRNTAACREFTKIPADVRLAMPLRMLAWLNLRSMVDVFKR